MGPLNGLAKLFLQQLDLGVKFAQIQQSILTFIKGHNLTLVEIVERLQKGYKGREYRKQFKVLSGFLYERFLECHDSKKAFAEYKAAAETECPYGYLFVGICYENGIGVHIDSEKAFKNYQKSVEYSRNRPFPCGQYRLARCYERGIGTSVNHEFAFNCYTRAANAGNLDALNSLGCWYQKGKYVKQDFSEAYKNYKKAADGGLPCAQFNVAEFLRLGCGVKKNELEAFHWYQTAANNGESSAQYWLAQHYEEDKNKNDKLALKWYLKAAEATQITEEIVQTYYSLALIYDYGQLGVVRDDKKAFEWYQKASDVGIIEATRRLSECYRRGLGTEIDLEKANKLAKLISDTKENEAEKKYRRILSVSLSSIKTL
ncbi:5721_t:CDS:2 [Ambispora leptoticha]|uniref:5721_t:CDS:1 n=1 Tax=Ambispora leptoticha TaxID=144679 RepID=A0A9N9BHB5_9GLOM|nr:5721_t:CDS:2 [Ambispora leptoticha]